MKQIIIALILSLMASCVPPSEVVDVPPNSPLPTPTREGSSSSEDTDITGDPGSGVGFGTSLGDNGFLTLFFGAIDGEFTGDGVINCENGTYVIRATIDSFPQVSLILPQNASTGTYNLVNNTGDGTVATATVFLEDGRVFAAGIDGILIINDLATDPNQRVSGNFDFSASSGAQTVDARGEFDFTSSAGSVYCS